MEPAEVSRVLTARLTGAQLETLWSDLRHGATGLRVLAQPRAGTRSRAVGLDDARAAVEAGERVQIRYRVDGRAWSDTLFPEDDSVRLVRCPLPEEGEADAR